MSCRARAATLALSIGFPSFHRDGIPSWEYTWGMTKKKTTVYLDEELLRSARVMAARSGKKDYEVFEDALRSYLGMEALDVAWGSATLSEEDAIKLAVDEVHRFRTR